MAVWRLDVYERAPIRALVYGQQGITDQAKATRDTTEDSLDLFCSDREEEVTLANTLHQ